MTQVIEIGGHTQSPLGKRLSNFHARPFVFDGVKCASFEGFIQSLKCPDVTTQHGICKLTGIEAKRAGKPYNTWKENSERVLYWNGTVYRRKSRDYMLLIDRVYDTIYEQNKDFRDDLLKLGDARIWHSIGHPDQNQTTLTEWEMLQQLDRLRLRRIFELLSSLPVPNEA